MRTPRLRSAPLLDLVCFATFVLIGGRSHDMSEGISWFLRVMWPLCLGFFAVALLTRLYTSAGGVGWRLGATILGGVAIAQVLRGSFQHRPWVSAFILVAVTYLGLTMFGWRLLVAAVRRRRRPSLT
jgi:hypothetical protein